jgi:hypothetical protein
MTFFAGDVVIRFFVGFEVIYQGVLPTVLVRLDLWSRSVKAELLLLKLIHLFAREVLLVKKVGNRRN